MNEEEFIKELKRIGIELSDVQLKQLNNYYELLIQENEKINLTRIVEKKEVYLKHFYDSLTLVNIIDLNNELRLCDIGSGAGFPGIVLKIVFPKLDIVLVDSLNKRIKFLKMIIKELDLKNIIAVHDRAENYSRNNRNKFDIVTARAVARSEVLIELCVPLLKIGGHIIFMKANCDDEITNLEKLVDKYNSEINEIKKFNLPIENSNRTLIDVVKKSHVSEKYPRSIEKIKKENLE